MDNKLTGLVLVGTTNATLKANAQYLTTVPKIVADIFDISRSVTTLQEQTYYIVINYDINSKVSLVSSSDVDGVDDAWTLEKIDVTLVSDQGSKENETGSSRLYNPSQVTFNFPTNKKEISLAKLSIEVAEDSQVIKNINNVILDISCSVGLTSDGRFSLSKDEINFVGADASYELHEDLAKHQLAAYKTTVDNNVFTSQNSLDRDNINLDNPDILTAKLSTTDDFAIPNVNQGLLKTWYNETLNNLVDHVNQVKILEEVSVTINAIDPSTNHVLSQWARSKLQALDNSGNQTWSDNEGLPRTLDNPFAEGDYVICSTSFDYQPQVTNSGEVEKNLLDQPESVYVVLKQVTP